MHSQTFNMQEHVWKGAQTSTQTPISEFTQTPKLIKISEITVNTHTHAEGTTREYFK